MDEYFQTKFHDKSNIWTPHPVAVLGFDLIGGVTLSMGVVGDAVKINLSAKC